ncbi:TlpA family protein disulfide reductase [Pseudohalioglobus lutimaris]|uniref:TlpA family protein disulfide reductase n=1 Tax=Pseudohalioglobus lutimaris TaxID=1737061 RepID=A0A2N5X0U7_9GAMM|nr:TlpA disulfide reductase family protein [Pseudohalioglobus lutimaris]PLW68125.1 TlpA family protein disulfide reductase [Pseudohalioglobus lutimaris]
MKLILLALLVFCAPLASAVTDQGSAANFTLKSTTGENIRLSEYRGEVVLINFWASWCGPCRQEMPELEALHQRYRDLGFTVFGINVEQDRSSAERILRDLGLSFPVLFDDDNQVSELYDVDAMPVTVLVDRNGEVRFAHKGYKPGYEAMYEQQIRELVKE